MVLCSVDCIHEITNYLEVPNQKLVVTENNVPAAENLVKNKTVTGFSTIVEELLLRSKSINLLGDDEITKALSRQWLEYAAVCVNYADSSANVKRVLKEMNQALKTNSYITGTTRTIADIALFYGLHSIMNGLTNQEKAEFVNVSRWFDNLQQDAKLRNNLSLINFNVAALYL